jgi:hypothetical protein
MELVRKYFDKVWHRECIYRTCGVTLYDLRPTDLGQQDLFGEFNKETKFEAVHKQIDFLEDKFGKRMVYLGSTHDALKRKGKGTELNDPNRDLLFL